LALTTRWLAGQLQSDSCFTPLLGQVFGQHGVTR
jgi:hypothetical protein